MQYVFFWGGGGVRDVSTCGTLLLRLPHLFLDFLSSINPVSTPFGREAGGGGDSRMSQPPVLCIPGFRFSFLASSVPLALFRLRNI